MAIAFVQEAGIAVNSGTSGVSPTLGSAPGAGSLLIISHTSNAQTVSGITGYGVTTWAVAKASAFNNYDATIWYGIVDATPSASGTVTVSGSAYHSVHISEYSGLDGSGTLQAQNDTDSGNGTAASTGPITGGASSVPCLYVSVLAIGNSRTASSPSGSFTDLTPVSSPNTTLRNYTAYRIDSPTPSSATSGWTVGSGQWEMSICCFKGTADATVTGPGFIGGGFFS